MLIGVGEFLREVAGMLLNEYQRWLTGSIFLLLVVGVVDAAGLHWAATGVVWLAFVPAALVSVHAAIRSRRRLAVARSGIPADAGRDDDEPALEPILVFEEPRLEPRDPAGSKRSSGMVLCAAITNAPPGSDRAGKALRAVPSITWTTPGAEAQGPIEGRWRAVPSAATLDLLPNGRPYLLELALKLPGEKHFRVIGRDRSYLVPDERARVTVEVRGANFAPATVTYKVWSEGDGESTLRFSKST